MLSLLLSRRGDVSRPSRFEQSVAAAIMTGRGASRASAEAVATAELAAIGAPSVPRTTELISAAASDAARAVRAAKSLAERAAKAMRGGLSVAEAKAAIKPALELTAATESASAYNEGRDAMARSSPVIRLLKVWDAVLDKRTCPTCSGLDGTIVGARESFPIQQPAHPRCRCTFTLLRSDETDGEMLIAPVKKRL